MKTGHFLFFIFLLVDAISAQSYCDNEAFFLEQSSMSNLFSESIPYCIDCPDEEGILQTYNILLHRPIDALNNDLPLRPHIMFVHGYGPNTGLADPYAVPFAQAVRTDFSFYGYSASALQYRQDVLGFQIPLCDIPEIEVVKTHYRAIQDLRAALDLLYQDAENYGIDTTHFFLMGNSQGATVILNAMLAEDEQVWLEQAFPQYLAIKDTLGPWVPKHQIKALMPLAGALYDPGFLDENDSLALFLGHGVCDTVVPYRTGTYFNCPMDIIAHGSYSLACRADSLNIPYSLHSINGLGHEWTEAMNDTILLKIRDWMKNQIICGIPGQEYFTYTADVASCDSVGNDILDCTVTSSSRPYIENEKIKIYPNPAGHAVFLDLQNVEQKGFLLMLHNYQGHCLLKIRNDQAVNQIIKINTSELASGLYFLNVIGAENRRSVHKIFIVH